MLSVTLLASGTDTVNEQKLSEEQWEEKWRAEFQDEETVGLIRELVDRSMPDYLYLKQFALTPGD